MTFITAKEAKDLVLNSQAEVDRIMPLIDAHIRDVAEDGGRFFHAYREVPWESQPKDEVTKTSKLQERIIERLYTLGFNAAIVIDGEYVSRELADSTGYGPLFSNRVLKVSW